MKAELTHAQCRQIEALDRAASDLAAVIGQALRGHKAKLGEIMASINGAVEVARQAITTPPE
jgi:hypothetical protein